MSVQILAGTLPMHCSSILVVVLAADVSDAVSFETAARTRQQSAFL